MTSPSDAPPVDLDLGQVLGGGAEEDDAVDVPTQAAIWAAVSGELSDDDLRELLARARAEPGVAEAWRVARSVHAEVVSESLSPQVNENVAAEVIVGPSSWWRRHGPTGLGLAAVGALAAAALLWVAPPAAPSDGGPTAGGPMRAETSLIQNQAEPGAVLDPDGAVLAWSASEPGGRYSVTVMTDNLAPIARVGGLTEPRWTVPADVLASLPPGTVVLWRVEVQLPDGRRHRSPTFEGVLP